jgi:uncharacterized membrane-anchored protein
LLIDFGATKVPEITAAFWVIKVLTTGMGESASDFLVHDYGGPKAVPVGLVVFVVALWLQLRLRHYARWIYWLAVSMVAVFGTMTADVLHIGLGIPYVVSTCFFAVVVAVAFWAWHHVEGTLSIHSITTRRRELFYWTAVLATFALGTAAGDYTARTLHLGFGGSAFLFAGLIAIPALAFFVTRRHAIFWFWCAYVITRPLGASMADYMAVGKVHGGLGWGYGTVTVLWTVLIVIAVGYLAIRHVDVAPRSSSRD